jgi:hypothetical protein
MSRMPQFAMISFLVAGDKDYVIIDGFPIVIKLKPTDSN